MLPPVELPSGKKRMRASPGCCTSSAAEVTCSTVPPGMPCGSRPGEANVRAFRSSVNHCGRCSTSARVRVWRSAAAMSRADASSRARSSPPSRLNAVTASAMPSSASTARISSKVKPRCFMRAISLLPIPVIRVHALAAGLAVTTVEDDVVLAMLAGHHVAERMAPRILEVTGLGVRAVPRRRIPRLGQQALQFLRRRALVQHVGVNVLAELRDLQLAGLVVRLGDAAADRARDDGRDDAQQHDHRKHFEQGEAQGPGTGDRNPGKARAPRNVVPFLTPGAWSLVPHFQLDHLIISEWLH